MTTTTALRKMRIIAIPLTRPRTIPQVGLATGTKLNGLTYYQFQISAKKPAKTPLASGTVKEGETDGNSEKRGWFRLPEEGIANWATQKAADTWSGFGKAKGGWKLRVYQGGEKLVDRMEFEELALKSIDPSLGPSITRLQRTPSIDEKQEPLAIPLIFPPSILSSSTVLSELRAYTDHRIPRHKRAFYFWAILAPFTAPFMIIPIIPNLPFFFCVWRAWSNYRAYRSSQYLQSLLQHNMIAPESSEPLDQVYKLHQIVAPTSPASPPDSDASETSSTSHSSSAPASEPKHDILLTRDAVPDILSAFGFAPDSTAAADLHRAVEQARVRVASGRTDL